MYLANENLPLTTVRTLQSRGINIVSIKNISPGANDEDVLSVSLNENRILITFDKDFGEWVFKKKEKTPKGIILLRFSPKSADYITSELLKLFKKNIDFEKHFTVVDENKIRTVPL